MLFHLLISFGRLGHGTGSQGISASWFAKLGSEAVGGFTVMSAGGVASRWVPAGDLAWCSKALAIG